MDGCPPASTADLTVFLYSFTGAGGNGEATLTVHNSGPDTAEDVVTTSTLPAGNPWISAPTGCTIDGLTMTCDFWLSSSWNISKINPGNVFLWWNWCIN